MVVFACLGAVLLAAPGTSGAFLSDTEQATDNSVAAGTVDVKLSEVGPATENSTTDDQSVDTATATWLDSEHEDAGGGRDDVVNNTLQIEDGASSRSIGRVNLTVTYAENDSDGPEGNADVTARSMVIETLTYRDQDLVGSVVVDENGNGHVDLEDLTLGDTADNLSTLEGFGSSTGAGLTLAINGEVSAFQGAPDPGGGPGGGSGGASGEGIEFTVIVRCTGGGFSDADRSTDNVVIHA